MQLNTVNQDVLGKLLTLTYCAYSSVTVFSSLVFTRVIPSPIPRVIQRKTLKELHKPWKIVA